MRWELSQDQEMYRESMRGWVEKFAPSDAVRGWFDSGDSSDFDSKFVSEGWFSVGLSEDIGGQGGGLLELSLTAVELARCAAPSSAWMASVLAAPLLGPGLAERVLQSGEFAAVVADSSRPLDAAPRLQISGNVVTGVVTSVLGADRADHFVVPVAGPGGVQLVSVASTAPGVSVEKSVLLDRSRSVATVKFDGAVVSPLEAGADALSEASLVAAVLTAADSLGVLERMLELAVEYSKTRHQFGVPIGSFQAVKHTAASILVFVEAARSIVFYAAESVNTRHEDRALHAATAKAQVTASGVGAADSSLTIHGAVGYTWEHDLHLFYKRAKLDEKLFGAPAVWNERIAQALPLLPNVAV